MSKILKSLVLLALMFPLVSASDQPENKITVAVYPIKITGADKSLEPVLTSLYITKLSQSTKLKVIEEAMMDEVLKRLNFANSDMCDNSQCQLQVGKMTPASKMIVPTVSKLGDKYILNARVIDIQRADIDFSTETKLVCKEDELDELVEDASYDLREKFGEKVVRPHPSAQPQVSPASASLPSSSADPLDSQNILGIVVENAPERQGEGVIVKSVLPDSPCKDIFKPGNLFTYMNPQGRLSGIRSTDAPYHISDINDFRKLVASIKPGASVAFMMGATIAHRANCVIPSQLQTTPQTPAPPPAPTPSPAPAPRAQKRAGG
jgi:hypothetical protein